MLSPESEEAGGSAATSAVLCATAENKLSCSAHSRRHTEGSMAGVTTRWAAAAEVDEEEEEDEEDEDDFSTVSVLFVAMRAMHAATPAKSV